MLLKQNGSDEYSMNRKMLMDRVLFKETKYIGGGELILEPNVHFND